MVSLQFLSDVNKVLDHKFVQHKFCGLANFGECFTKVTNSCPSAGADCAIGRDAGQRGGEDEQPGPEAVNPGPGLPASS